MNELASILSEFQQITLAEMDSVQLMSRTDTKYVFNAQFLSEILIKLSDHYKVLNVKDLNINDYQTLYYDTDDFLFYHHHQQGKGNRCKVRSRTYLQSDLHFFEVKNKNNKSITVKKRIKTAEHVSQLDEPCEKFYHKNAIVNDADLKPKLWVNYSRITLVNKNQPERLTLDINLHFVNDELTIPYDSIVIAELKQERRQNSVFKSLMKEFSVREKSISKYCLGIVSLYPEVKQNNFKPILLTLNKISHEQI